jgi:hypothetical protein
MCPFLRQGIYISFTDSRVEYDNWENVSLLPQERDVLPVIIFHPGI